MRKLISGLFISLDGVAEAPDQWQFDVFDDDMGAAMMAHLAQEDEMLMGRVTYQEWAGYWPSAPADDPYGAHINGIPKHVVSTTLDQVAWGDLGKVALVKGDLAEYVNRLKQQPGKNIGVGGSITLVRSLLALNLLDELVLMIHPVVVGHGQRLFREGDDLRRLTLTRHQVTGSGVAILTYVPK